MIRIFCKYNNRIVQLPVNPEDLFINGASKNNTVNMANKGELNNIGYKELRDISINSFFPMKPDANYINTLGDFEEPDFYIDFFEGVQKDRKPFRLIVTGTEINMLVSIESFEYGLVHGTNDIEYTLDLKEYKDHNIRILSATGQVINGNQEVAQAAPTATNSNRSIEKIVPTSYTVRAGDTLWQIAQRLLGSGSKWKDIYTYNNNRNIIGGNPNLLEAGQVLAIPQQ